MTGIQAFLLANQTIIRLLKMYSGWRIVKYDKEKGWHDPVLDLIVSVSQDASRRLRTIEGSVTISALCFISSLSTQLCFISVCPEEL